MRKTRKEEDYRAYGEMKGPGSDEMEGLLKWVGEVNACGKEKELCEQKSGVSRGGMNRDE